MRMFSLGPWYTGTSNCGGLRELGYDARSRRMRVRYYSGSLYEYSGVSPLEVAELMGAEPLGAELTKISVRGTGVLLEEARSELLVRLARYEDALRRISVCSEEPATIAAVALVAEEALR